MILANAAVLANLIIFMLIAAFSFDIARFRFATRRWAWGWTFFGLSMIQIAAVRAAVFSGIIDGSSLVNSWATFATSLCLIFILREVRSIIAQPNGGIK